MYLIKGNNINEVQLTLLNLLKTNGVEVLVRNFKTIEVYPVILHLTKIRNRCTTLIERNWNIVYALGELVWHLNGSNDLSSINYYTKNWDSISDDRKHIPDSCYGSKIFKQSNDWNNLISELRHDVNSRRAVINLYASENTLGKNISDVACTLSLQFLIRNGRLDLIVTMRSNDIIWGLPNDIFFFTMLQEYLANILCIEPGEYYHQIASLHIYDRHFGLMEKIISNPEYFEFTMPNMSDTNNLDSFLSAECKIRQNEINVINLESNYWQELLNVLTLRSLNLDSSEKNKITNNSAYKRIIELCPSKYLIDSR